jgi:hypothetical protein
MSDKNRDVYATENTLKPVYLIIRFLFLSILVPFGDWRSIISDMHYDTQVWWLRKTLETGINFFILFLLNQYLRNAITVNSYV